jgi:site-specific recombinase XerD
LNRDEVVRLLATTEGDHTFDIRARAILMLLITYGLRAGEVSGLQLDDLDWEREMLRVRCPKPGRTHLYPLSRGVGQTILRYLSEVRPKPSALTGTDPVLLMELDPASAHGFVTNWSDQTIPGRA